LTFKKIEKSKYLLVGPQISRQKRAGNYYMRDRFAQLIKNIRCLRVNLRYNALKKSQVHSYHYGKREVINSLDDCFDFIGEPLYGFRTLLSTQKFCLGSDFNCLQTSSPRNPGFQSRQTEEFSSEGPADCRVSLTQNTNCV